MITLDINGIIPSPKLSSICQGIAVKHVELPSFVIIKDIYSSVVYGGAGMAFAKVLFPEY
jgi:hypothetical protein